MAGINATANCVDDRTPRRAPERPRQAINGTVLINQQAGGTGDVAGF